MHLPSGLSLLRGCAGSPLCVALRAHRLRRGRLRARMRRRRGHCAYAAPRIRLTPCKLRAEFLGYFRRGASFAMTCGVNCLVIRGAIEQRIVVRTFTNSRNSHIFANSCNSHIRKLAILILHVGFVILRKIKTNNKRYVPRTNLYVSHGLGVWLGWTTELIISLAHQIKKIKIR